MYQKNVKEITDKRSIDESRPVRMDANAVFLFPSVLYKYSVYYSVRITQSETSKFERSRVKLRISLTVG
jgi:hypothetical protein